MSSQPTSVRGPRPQKLLWKWTAVSAVLHVLLVALLCGLSYASHQKKQAELAAQTAAAETAAQKAEAARIAAHAVVAPTPTPAPTAVATAAPTAAPRQAEAILGIDKTAKPGETPSSPFSGGNDDLLKDLK